MNITIPQLQPGERYAGLVLDEASQPARHLVLLAARPDKRLNWRAALDWAKSVGGDLPTRQELALLYANCKPHLPQAWAWSREEYEGDASYAWCCDFGYGGQGSHHKSFQGSAVAVRTILITD